ncbi:MAG: hypothetical protein M0Z50_16015 [Planctomycetia bacterium]|nr:hypothetical protein [Planctomycetia bacterium]
MSMTTAAFIGMGSVVLYGLVALGIAFASAGLTGRKPARQGRRPNHKYTLNRLSTR